jgi:DNA-binding NtrC family response regulator
VDLKAAIAAGTFRQDLYYRLNVIPLRIPPLRERGDDILLLAHHFLVRHAQTAGRPHLRMDDAVADCLLAHSWPGSVRELSHAIEHAVVLSTGNTVDVSSLPAEVRGHVPPGDDVPQSAPRPISEDGTAAPPSEVSISGMRQFMATYGLASQPYADARQRLLSAFNEVYVAKALASCGGNISEAARRSGVDRSNFRRLMRATPSGMKLEDMRAVVRSASQPTPPDHLAQPRPIEPE